jgi:hypothetical protein
MISAEIIAAVRYAIREPSPQRVSDDNITDTLSRGVKVMGLAVKKSSPEFCTRQKAIDSETNIFSWPDNCLQIVNVWDLRTSAIAITDATNASPIVITAEDHGRSDGEIIHVQDVLGNTAANDVWEVDEATDDTLELLGSTGNAAYTSGGLLYLERKNMTLIGRMKDRNSRMSNSGAWFPRGKKIVIDNSSFTRDIVVDYILQFTELTDIPDDYHEGLIAFCVIELMIMPARNHPEYTDKVQTLSRMTGILDTTYKDISDLKVSSEPKRFPRGINWGGMAT